MFSNALRNFEVQLGAVPLFRHCAFRTQCRTLDCNAVPTFLSTKHLLKRRDSLRRIVNGSDLSDEECLDVYHVLLSALSRKHRIKFSGPDQYVLDSIYVWDGTVALEAFRTSFRCPLTI